MPKEFKNLEKKNFNVKTFCENQYNRLGFRVSLYSKFAETFGPVLDKMEFKKSGKRYNYDLDESPNFPQGNKHEKITDELGALTTAEVLDYEKKDTTLNNTGFIPISDGTELVEADPETIKRVGAEHLNTAKASIETVKKEIKPVLQYINDNADHDLAILYANYMRLLDFDEKKGNALLAFYENPALNEALSLIPIELKDNLKIDIKDSKEVFKGKSEAFIDSKYENSSVNLDQFREPVKDISKKHKESKKIEDINNLINNENILEDSNSLIINNENDNTGIKNINLNPGMKKEVHYAITENSNNLYGDYLRIKNSAYELLKLEGKKQSLRKKGWPADEKIEYLKNLKDTNYLLITSYERITNAGAGKNAPLYDAYMENTLSTISGLGSGEALNRGMGNSIGYLKGVNKAIDNGWDPEEFIIMGSIFGIYEYMDRCLKDINIKISKYQNNELIVLNNDEQISVLQDKKKELEEFWSDINKLKNDAQNKKIVTENDKAEIVEKFIDFSDKYLPIVNDFNSRNIDEKGGQILASAMKFVTIHSSVINSACEEIGRKAEAEAQKGNEYILDQKQMDAEFFAQNAKYFGLPDDKHAVSENDRALCTQTTKFLKSLYRINEYIDKNYEDIQNDIKNKIQNKLKNENDIRKILDKDTIKENKILKEWCMSFKLLYNRIKEKPLKSFENFNDIVRDTALLLWNKKQNKDLPIPKELVKLEAVKDLKVSIKSMKNLRISNAQKERMKGITDERFGYLVNVLTNLKHDNNKKSSANHGGQNNNTYDNMIKELDKLVNMGPEKKLAVEKRKAYYEQKDKTLQACKAYLSHVGYNTSYHKSGTRRKNAAILVVNMIDPVLGAEEIKNANDARKRWNSINLETLKNAEGVGTKFSAPSNSSVRTM